MIDEMTDKEFLTWVHERLEHVHGESPNIAHMHRLRKIIEAADGAAAKYERERAAGELRDYPALRAERVCKHYIKLSLLAKDIHDAIQLREFRPSGELDDLVDNCLKIINDEHKKDFGRGLWDE